jgi:alpha-mannosidase
MPTMSYRELCILLPCHGLEDFPVHHRGAEADNLLAAWTSIWHPALIAATGQGPRWRRADDPPDPLEQVLVAIPQVSLPELPSGFVARARESRASVLDQESREAMLAAALEPLGEMAQFPSEELVADFLALGYCFLQVELLTRQMRYASNLDEHGFRETLLEAARKGAEGDESAARQRLGTCFDMLGEERDHYYSVDAFLVDLTLLAPTTLGPSFHRQLAASEPQNLLLTGDVLEQLATVAPETLQRVREKLEQDELGLVGGEQREDSMPLKSLESWRANLQAGLATYQRWLGRRPTVFGRRRYGLSPLMPQVLHRFDFQAALHATLDDGQFPEASQVKTRWEGIDATALDAMARVPLDANDPGTFLSLALRLGESMDMDHVATLCLAHWPGHASRWYDELKRVTRFTSALGRFTTLDHYFRETALPGHLDRFTADQYRSPYLQQAVHEHSPDPLSVVQRYWRAELARRNRVTLDALTTFLLGTQPSQADFRREMDAPEPPASSNSRQLDPRLEESLQRLARAVLTGEDNRPGQLVINPFPFARRLAIDYSATAPLEESASCVASEWTGSGVRAVVDVPPCGFTWLKQAGEPPATPQRRSKRAKLLAEEDVLRNEYFEARIHPETGGLLSLRSFTARGNLLSQQLGFRLPPRPRTHPPSESAEAPPQHYSRMVGQSREVRLASAVCGEIQTTGVLVDDEQQEEVAQFTQTFRVWRGKRTLELEIALTPRTPPRADPWNSYYACRFAWGDEEALLARSFQETRQSTHLARLESPHFFEVDNGHHKVAILTGGLPYHRLVGNRALDSLLVVHGESERHFRLGMGVELPHPYVESLDFLAPPLVHGSDLGPRGSSSGWFFQTGVKNVEVTHWEPLLESERCVGFRARLLETAGVPTRLNLAALYPFKSARQIDFLGRSLGDCAVDEGRASLAISRFEWIEIEARW